MVPEAANWSIVIRMKKNNVLISAQSEYKCQNWDMVVVN